MKNCVAIFPQNIENSSNICTKIADDYDNLLTPPNTEEQAVCSKSGHGMSLKWSHNNRDNITLNSRQDIYLPTGNNGICIYVCTIKTSQR